MYDFNTSFAKNGVYIREQHVISAGNEQKLRERAQRIYGIRKLEEIINSAFNVANISV